MAEMVRLGFTAAEVGITLASTTVRFSSPRNRQSASSALVYGIGAHAHRPHAVAEGGHLVAVEGEGAGAAEDPLGDARQRRARGLVARGVPVADEEPGNAVAVGRRSRRAGRCSRRPAGPPPSPAGR